MQKGTQEEFSLDEVISHVVEAVGSDNLSFYHPSRDWAIVDPAPENIAS